MKRMFGPPQCHRCGRFCRLGGGASSATMYDMVAMECTGEAVRCAKCTAEIGSVQSNARPSDGDMSPYQSVHA